MLINYITKSGLKSLIMCVDEIMSNFSSRTAVIFASQHKSPYADRNWISICIGSFRRGHIFTLPLSRITWENLHIYEQIPFCLRRKLTANVSCLYVHVHTSARVWEKYERVSLLLRKSCPPVSMHMYLRTFICIKLDRNLTLNEENNFFLDLFNSFGIWIRFLFKHWGI